MKTSQLTDNLVFMFSLSLRMSFHKTFLCCILTSDLYELYVHIDFHLQKEKFISILIYSIIVQVLIHQQGKMIFIETYCQERIYLPILEYL